MLCFLNCMYTACYKWHDITINKMKYNPVRIMHDMRTEKWEKIWHECKTIAGLYLIMSKMENYWDLMYYVCSCIGGYPYFITMGRGTIILFYIMLSWWLLVLTGVWPKELPEYARLTRKVTQRCANWLVSPYSHVWATCRVYGTHPSYPLGQYRRKIDWKDRSRHCIRMFLHLTPIVGSLTDYFFKYSSHVLLHFSGLGKTFRLTTVSQFETMAHAYGSGI